MPTSHRLAFVAALCSLGLACGGGGGGGSVRTIPDGGTAWACSPCELYDVEVDGDVAFLADHTNGVIVLDVRDPAAPKQVGAIAASPNAIALHGDVLYVSDYKRGLVVLDVADLAHPTEITVIDTNDGDYYAEVSGTTLYSANDVFDITDPRNPQKKAHIAMNSSTMDAAVDGNILWLPDANEGFASVDVTDPANPKPLGRVATDYSKDVCIVGTHAFVPQNNDQTLEVFDISNPSSPTKVTAAALGGAGTGCALTDGGEVAVAAGGKGILVFDVSDPAAPKQIKATEGYHDTYKVFASGARVYGADKSKGLLILDL